MNFFSLIGVELKKLRRSKIVWLLLIPIIVLWVPMVVNARIHLTPQPQDISPENNFLIQSFLGLSWFMFPASLVIATVLLNQTERSHKGILKMLSLPVNRAKLCMAKFVVLLLLAAFQMCMMVVLYFPCAAAASQIVDYPFMVSPGMVLKIAGVNYLTAIPMAAVYWMLSVCIQTPIFSIGAGLATIVPSVLIMNTKAWFIYPMCYPFMMTTSEMHKLAANMGTFDYQLVPWIPVAAGITLVCLVMSCLLFGRAERKG